MGTRVPVQHYGLRSPNSFLGSSLHDLNTVDSRTGEIEGMSDVERDAVTDDGLDNDDESNSADCMHESYRNPLPLHNVGVEADHSSLQNNGPSAGPYDMLTIEDVTPIETARARFLQIIVDHFIKEHVVEMAESEVSYAAQSEQDKLNKRKLREVQYEGDSRFVLPLMYVANMYETLVDGVNSRLASLTGMREKTIGVALEAAGGLYRKLAKKFPRKGPCTFKRRELATSLETRNRFPELVIQEEKRVRFVVVNGLDIIEKPNSMSVDDSEWFRRLTGRSEVSISAQDYKFYSPRHKYRRIASNTSNIPVFPTFPGADCAQEFCSLNEAENQNQTPSKHHMQALCHQAQFHSIQQSHHPHFSHNNHQGMQLPEISQTHHSTSISPHMACLQPLPGGSHVGGRLQAMPTTPAKFCDECGSPYMRDVSKFCAQCGAKRLWA